MFNFRKIYRFPFAILLPLAIFASGCETFHPVTRDTVKEFDLKNRPPIDEQEILIFASPSWAQMAIIDSPEKANIKPMARAAGMSYDDIENDQRKEDALNKAIEDAHEVAASGLHIMVGSVKYQRYNYAENEFPVSGIRYLLPKVKHGSRVVFNNPMQSPLEAHHRRGLFRHEERRGNERPTFSFNDLSPAVYLNDSFSGTLKDVESYEYTLNYRPADRGLRPPDSDAISQWSEQVREPMAKIVVTRIGDVERRFHRVSIDYNIVCYLRFSDEMSFYTPYEYNGFSKEDARESCEFVERYAKNNEVSGLSFRQFMADRVERYLN